ncbi:MAG: helix-turn-helix domain-containing protein [Ruminococcus sp.]|nr:helix-turn-helix domain-containing protein [Ruminococcus sp.]
MNVEHLKLARKQSGMTQKEVADNIGVGQSTYKNYECGIREPNGDTIVELANLFGVTTDYLLGREPAPDDPIETLSRELNLNLYEKAIVTAYLAMDTKSRTDLVKMVQTVADAVQSGAESKYTYTIQVAARGDAAKSRQEQGEDVTVSTTLGAVEDQMEEAAKTKEEASS